jgi:hypothetical protein
MFQNNEKCDCEREIFWLDAKGTRHVVPLLWTVLVLFVAHSVVRQGKKRNASHDRNTNGGRTLPSGGRYNCSRTLDDAGTSGN